MQATGPCIATACGKSLMPRVAQLVGRCGRSCEGVQAELRRCAATRLASRGCTKGEERGAALFREMHHSSMTWRCDSCVERSFGQGLRSAQVRDELRLPGGAADVLRWVSVGWGRCTTCAVRCLRV